MDDGSRTEERSSSPSPEYPPLASKARLSEQLLLAGAKNGLVVECPMDAELAVLNKGVVCMVGEVIGEGANRTLVF
jgi:hypothetical protein